MHVLITGGAGFIGPHVCEELLRRNHRVRVLDNLDAQVHERGEGPAYLTADAEFVIFVSPALYEPFGLAVVEAAQSGCALVPPVQLPVSAMGAAP